MSIYSAQNGFLITGYNAHVLRWKPTPSIPLVFVKDRSCNDPQLAARRRTGMSWEGQHIGRLVRYLTSHCVGTVFYNKIQDDDDDDNANHNRSFANCCCRIYIHIELYRPTVFFFFEDDEDDDDDDDNANHNRSFANCCCRIYIYLFLYMPSEGQPHHATQARARAALPRHHAGQPSPLRLPHGFRQPKSDSQPERRDKHRLLPRANQR
ncbi:hypothetical protein T492DRAFT_941658 [Pavlovales sp. CCMP2436]|nr:hypothetical protein T492DRAFT_941658 [Pavlovales sp. CCMP2436]